MHRSFVFLIAALLAGCGSKSSASTPPDAGPADAGILIERPYTLVVPTSYSASTPAPLVFMFHGYSVDGVLEEAYMNISAAAQTHGFLYAYADGTVDQSGNRFWNATDACCDFWDTGV